MDISVFIEAISRNQVKITDHADEEALADRLTIDEVYFSVLHGEIIEEYVSDWPYPSCLIYGRTFDEGHVHSVWAYNESTRWAVLITVYRPSPELWIGWRERRRQ